MASLLGGREATTGNTSAVRRLVFLRGGNDVKPFCFQSLDKTAFLGMFPYITALHYEANNFEHNNNRIERELREL